MSTVRRDKTQKGATNGSCSGCVCIGSASCFGVVCTGSACIGCVCIVCTGSACCGLRASSDGATSTR